MREQSMKKNTVRSFGALHIILIIFTVTTLMYGCSDMITTLLASTAAGKDAAALSSDDFTFASGDTADSVTGDFTLPITGELNTTTISWESDNTDIITIDNETGTATVTSPEDDDTDVTLTATLTDADGTTVTKTIIVTVVVSTDAGDDAAALSTDDITFASGDTVDAVTGDFTLPITGEINTSTTVSWESDNTDIITIDGETGTAAVTRPSDEDTEVTLTATFTDNEGNTSSKTITVTVLVLVQEAGFLDTSFNASGDQPGLVWYKRLVDVYSAKNYGLSMALASDGKILVTGYEYTSTSSTSNYSMFLWRYNSDGTLDSTFGEISDYDGIVTYNGAAGRTGRDIGHSVAVDSDGKILVAGESMNSDPNFGQLDMVLWRYNSDGTLDTSFNASGTTPGIVAHDGAAGGGMTDYGYSVALASDGKILVTGGSYNNNGDIEMVIWCYNSDGTLDTSFNASGTTPGIVTYAGVENGFDMGYSATVDSAGKILVTGESFNGNNSDMAIWRYNSDGTPDTTFGDGGIVVNNNAAGGEDSDHGYSVIVDSNGKILVTGESSSPSGRKMVIWRYNSDGTPDTTFNDDGIVVFSDEDIFTSHGYAIQTDSSGKILVTGEYEDSYLYNDGMAIWRYKSDGTPDAPFGSNGIVKYNRGSSSTSDTAGESLAIDSNGTILVSGGGEYHMAIWRYE